RHERHFADRLHKREPHPPAPSLVGRGGTIGFADVAAEHPRESTRGPGMARAALPVCIARNDGEWTVYRHGHHLLRVGMNHDCPTDPAVPLEALAIQPLARTRPFQLGQALIRCSSIGVLYGGGLN